MKVHRAMQRFSRSIGRQRTVTAETFSTLRLDGLVAIYSRVTAIAAINLQRARSLRRTDKPIVAEISSDLKMRVASSSGGDDLYDRAFVVPTTLYAMAFVRFSITA